MTAAPAKSSHGGTGKPAAPDFPYQHDDLAPESATRREQLARWITSKDNQYFAKSYVNRLWGYLFGRGIIDPIDDIRAGNPPTNPELLDRLTAEFVASGFDMQHMLRTICKSRTYQASIATNQWNQDDDINFSHAMARRLPAEVLYDAIQRATGSVSHLPGVPAGYRAAQLPDVGLTLPSGFFEVFGRPARESACECERSSGMMLGPVMTLVNGPTIADAIADPQQRPDQARGFRAERRQGGRRGFHAHLVASGRSRPRSKPASRRCTPAAANMPGWSPSWPSAKPRSTPSRPPGKPNKKAIAWTVAEPLEMTSSMNATFAKQPDNSVLVEGPTARGSYTIKLATDLADVTGIRLELLADAKLPASGPGRAPNGNVTLSEIKATAAPKADPAKAMPLTFASATADFSQEGYAVAGAIDGKPETHWAISPQTGKDHAGVFEIKEDLNLAGGCAADPDARPAVRRAAHDRQVPRGGDKRPSGR